MLLIRVVSIQYSVIAYPRSPVLLPTTVAPCSGTAHATTVLARPPAAAPAGGCVACRVPAPGLSPSSSMPRGPPAREDVRADGNRMGVDSCAPVGPTAASGPGFHVRWPPPGPRFSARSIPVSAGWHGPPADPVLLPLSINFFWFRAITAIPFTGLIDASCRFTV